jgi:3-oxoacyl-[acyl-carrier-protein] synthase II
LPRIIKNPYKSMPVAVTGIGMICPLGIATPVVWENILQGKSGIGRITKFDASQCATQIGGQLPEEYFELEKKKTPKRLFKQTIRASRLIRLCSQEALTDSSIELDKIDAYRCGVIIGTSGSSVRGPDDLGGPETKRFKIIREMINAPSAWISIENAFKGPSFTISAAYASGSYAVVRAFDLIRWGLLDVVVVGGVDCLLTKNNVKRGNLMKLLSTKNDGPEKAMRPFDQKRDGFVLSDGGCAVVLESYEHALKRNANVYAWIMGYGSLSEAYSLQSYSPNGTGMEQTIELTLKNTGIPKEKIGYVNANGTSTIVNDLRETAVIKKVFGKHAYDLLISSQKSMLGHCVGGADTIEFSVTALALKTQKIPPTINYEFPDPGCDLNYVPNAMTTISNLKAAITNSFGFGGHNCAIVLAKDP